MSKELLNDNELLHVTGGEAEIMNKIIELLKSKRNVTGNILKANIIEELGADSLDVVDILQTVTKEYNLNIGMPKPEQIKTVSDLCNFVLKK